MTGARVRLGVLVLVLAASGAQAGSLVLINGNFHTVNDRQPRAEAVIATDGRLAFVGSSVEARQRAPRDAQQVDLGGATVVPGFTDSHAHLAGIGQRELAFDLEGTTSVADLQARLKQRAASTKAGEWIFGRGWIESRWTPAVFPSRADLDAVVADRPVVLERADGHAVVANSLALKLARIDRTTANPSGGEILKDRQGEPTGMLIDKATDLVTRLVPPLSETEQLRQLEVGAERSVRVGWTQLQIAGNSLAEVEQLCALYAQGRIKLRIYDAVGGPGADADQLIEKGPSGIQCSDRLVVRSIKLYIDGALGSRGAALLAPYSDSPASSGLLVNREDELYRLLVGALRKGIQIETHAIGDRGNRLMLDLYERAFAAVPVPHRAVAEPRWRIEHAQVLHPDDIPQFAKLGVIASMQPSHAISDLYFAPSRLGPERVAGAYAWRSVLDAGAIIAGGSDAPVERGEPMIEFYAAAERRALDGFADNNWHREQRVTRAEALKMVTLWPAYAAFQEKERGSIEVGKLADLTVLSADIMQIPAPEILKSKVVMTIIGGEVAYSQPRRLK
jgi:predicted amidohydrolase YtcJ